MEDIEARLACIGWKTRQLPVSGGGLSDRKIIRWKVIGFKGDKTIQVEGKTLEEAMNNLGRILGLVPKNGIA
jgi:hypothetical protein